MLQTIEKVGLVLDLFTTSHPEWTLSEVAAEIGAPRSSAHGLLSSLVETGLLHSPRRGRYRVGLRVTELSEVHGRTVDLEAAGGVPLADLELRTGETSHLAVLCRWRAVYRYRLPGKHTVRAAGIPVEVPFDPHCSAVGKVLLAQRDPIEVRRNVLDRPLRRATGRTLIDADEVEAEIAEVRRSGWAEDQEEMLTGLCCVAAPVRDALGRTVAAIGVTAPSSRFAERRRELRLEVTRAASAASLVIAESELVRPAASRTAAHVSKTVPQTGRV